MWCSAAVLGAIGLTLSGCGGGGSSSCPDNAEFPAPSALLTATGSVSGKGTVSSQGTDINIDYSGSTNMWFANGSLRQDITMTGKATVQGQTVDITITQDQLQTCSNDTAEVTAYVEELGTGACATADIPLQSQNLTCANLTLWGTGSDKATCKDVEDCPSGGGKCDVWSLPSSSTSFHGQLFSKLKVMMLKAANAGSLAASSADSGTNDIYFKSGTNQVVAMKQSSSDADQTMEITITYDKWDTSSQVDSDHFVIPSEWQPCESTPTQSPSASATAPPVTAMV